MKEKEIKRDGERGKGMEIDVKTTGPELLSAY